MVWQLPVGFWSQAESTLLPGGQQAITEGDVPLIKGGFWGAAGAEPCCSRAGERRTGAAGGEAAQPTMDDGAEELEESWQASGIRALQRVGSLVEERAPGWLGQLLRSARLSFEQARRKEPLPGLSHPRSWYPNHHPVFGWRHHE